MNYGAAQTMDHNWKDVPLHGQADPVDVRVDTHVCRKIGERHMDEPREPWDEWMGTKLVNDFKALWPDGCRNDIERKTVTDVSDRIHQDALVSLQTPLLMKYNYQQKKKTEAAGTTSPTQSFGKPEPTQRLVLPNGGHAEIRRDGDGGWSLRTCYFDKAVSGRNEPVWRRYRGFVNRLRSRYLAAPRQGSSEPQIIDTYPKDDCIEWGIEFVSPYNWGLEASTPPDPWNHLPLPWPQPPAPPTAPPPGVLRPRPGGGTK